MQIVQIYRKHLKQFVVDRDWIIINIGFQRCSISIFTCLKPTSYCQYLILSNTYLSCISILLTRSNTVPRINSEETYLTNVFSKKVYTRKWTWFLKIKIFEFLEIMFLNNLDQDQANKSNKIKNQSTFWVLKISVLIKLLIFYKERIIKKI